MITDTLKKLTSNKNMAWHITHITFYVMCAFLIYDYKNWTIILPYSGYFALGFLILTLALNPLIKIKPYVFLLKLNRFRRQIGVASFSYALIHALCFLIKRLIDGKWMYFLHPAILPALLVALPILLILAATSNQYSIKKLSFKKWKSLHNKVYIAELFIIIHLIFSGEKRLALFTFGPLILIQGIRRHLNKHKKTEK